MTGLPLRFLRDALSLAPGRFLARALPVGFCLPGVLAAAYRAMAEAAPVPVCLHLDHCEDPALCTACADVDYTSIMIDASKQDLETNIQVTPMVMQFDPKAPEVVKSAFRSAAAELARQVSIAQLSRPAAASLEITG